MDRLPRDNQVLGLIKRKIKALYYAPDRATVEQKLRTKVIPAHINEKADMKLV